MYVQHIQIRIRNKELGANASPKFTCRDSEHTQQPVLLKHFQGLFQQVTQQLPDVALVMSKHTLHLLTLSHFQPYFYLQTDPK